MNILLVNPAGSDIFARFNAQMPPLGLGYIAACIRQEGHHVAIIDQGITPGRIQPATFMNYDVVGVTADTPRYFNALEVARDASQAGLPVVMGGYHATFMEEEILRTGFVDVIVRGEGEHTFSRLLNAFDAPDTLAALRSVKGIAYLDGDDLVITPDAPLLDDLDALPFPARDLFEMEKYKNHLGERPLASLITSRGCPYDCAFCASTRFGGTKWRYRSAKSIADEVEMLYHDYGYRAFTFLDDNFTTSKKRIMQLADELEQRQITDILWWCFSRVDTLLRNEDMVERMAQVGAFMIFVGLESVNDDTLNSYGKNIRHDQQTEAVALLSKYGIRLHGSFIMGDLDETPQQIDRTVEWALRLNPESLQFSILTPYPGTRLYENMLKEKRLLHRRWNLFDGFHSTIRLENFSPVELEKILFRSYRRFYLRLNRLTSGLRQNHHSADGKRYLLRKILRALRYYLALRKMFNNSETERAVATLSTHGSG